MVILLLSMYLYMDFKHMYGTTAQPIKSIVNIVTSARYYLIYVFKERLSCVVVSSLLHYIRVSNWYIHIRADGSSFTCTMMIIVRRIECFHAEFTASARPTQYVYVRRIQCFHRIVKGS